MVREQFAPDWIIRQRVCDVEHSPQNCAESPRVRHLEQVMIEQGMRQSAPARSSCASLAGSRIHNVRVSGYCVEVLRGEVTLP